MLRLSSFLALTLLATVASAHLCVYDPPQRGSLHLDHPGDSSCARFGPDSCGGIAAGPIQATYVAGSMATIQFQQNLNHFASAPVGKGTPGFFSAQIAPGAQPVESQFVDIAPIIDDINVMDEVWVGNFTLSATIPQFTCNPCTLRLQYSPSGSTNISDNFIQCVDIAISASKQPNLGAASEQLFSRQKHHVKPAHSKRPKAASTDCCSPQQFESIFVTGSADGAVSYDGVNQRLYWKMPQDNPGGGNAGGAQGSFNHHYINFTSGLEYVFDDFLGTCISHTTDSWEPWCYGSTESEEFERQVTVAGQPVNIYTNKAANFFFGATAVECLPLMRERQYIDTMQYVDTTLGIADPTIFFAPSVCTQAKVVPRKTPAVSHKMMGISKKH